MYQKLKELNLREGLYTQSMDNETLRQVILKHGQAIIDLFQTSDQFSQIEYLAEGEENYIYKILGQKDVYVARVLKPDNVRTRQDYDFEFAFQNYLRSHGVPIPKDYPYLNGETHAMFVLGDARMQITLHEFVVGKTVVAPNILQIQAAGALLGKLHSLATMFNISYDRLKHSDSLSWLDDIYDAGSISNNLAREAYALYQKHSSYIKANLSELSRVPLHNDIHFGNLLFDGNRLVAVLDFDESHKHYAPLELGWSIGQICNIGDVESLKPNLKVFQQSYSNQHKLSDLEWSVAQSALVAETSRKFLEHSSDQTLRRKFQNIYDLLNVGGLSPMRTRTTLTDEVRSPK